VAELKLAAKDEAGAEAQLREALVREPAALEGHLMLARLQLGRGVLHEALEEYRRALAIDAASAEAGREVKRLEAEFKLPKRPLKGNLNGVYWAAGQSLERLYVERRAARPALGGLIRLRLKLSAKGVLDGVEIVEDTVKDPVLLGHVWFSLRDAAYQDRKKLEAVIEFTLGKKKT
jgi:hypothetical protein